MNILFHRHPVNAKNLTIKAQCATSEHEKQVPTKTKICWQQIGESACNGHAKSKVNRPPINMEERPVTRYNRSIQLVYCKASPRKVSGRVLVI